MACIFKITKCDLKDCDRRHAGRSSREVEGEAPSRWTTDEGDWCHFSAFAVQSRAGQLVTRDAAFEDGTCSCGNHCTRNLKEDRRHPWSTSIAGYRSGRTLRSEDIAFERASAPQCRSISRGLSLQADESRSCVFKIAFCDLKDRPRSTSQISAIGIHGTRRSDGSDDLEQSARRSDERLYREGICSPTGAVGNQRTTRAKAGRTGKVRRRHGCRHEAASTPRAGRYGTTARKSS